LSIAKKECERFQNTLTPATSMPRTPYMEQEVARGGVKNHKIPFAIELLFLLTDI
jgi:hypothetical protein